ncbi:unnamed protein product [Closterium sp. NIES-54]
MLAESLAHALRAKLASSSSSSDLSKSSSNPSSRSRSFESRPATSLSSTSSKALDRCGAQAVRRFRRDPPHAWGCDEWACQRPHVLHPRAWFLGVERPHVVAVEEAAEAAVVAEAAAVAEAAGVAVELVAGLRRGVAPVVVRASSSSAVVRPSPFSSSVSGTLHASEVGVFGPCTYVLHTGDCAGEQCGGAHPTQRCFGRLTDAWRRQFPEATEIPRWGELSRAGVAIYDLDFDAILSAMYAVSISDEGDCYRCFPPDPGIGEAAALGACVAAALGAGASASSGTGESALSGTASALASLTFTLDSGASRSFFRDRTTLTPLSRPVAVSLADPSGGPVLSHFSTVLPCPAAPSGTLAKVSGSNPSVCTSGIPVRGGYQRSTGDPRLILGKGYRLVVLGGYGRTDPLLNKPFYPNVHQFTPACQRVTHCTEARTGRHPATFTRQPGSSLYTLTTPSPPVAKSGRVAAWGQVFATASRSGPESAPCSCRLLSHETLLWHHRLGHPSLLRLRGMASRFLPARGDLAAPPTWLHWDFSSWHPVEPPAASLRSPREWHDTLRTTLAALGFAPSTADPSLFLRTDTSLPPFYILVYVDDLVFATADTTGLAHVKSELQKRHTCTDMGELRSYLGLQITRDRARRTITLTQSHMVQQVLQRFGFTYSSPQATPLPTRHSLSALPSDESVESSGPYPELVGCLMYLMTCTRPDLAYPLSILARYVAPGRHRPEHMAATKRVLRYLCSTSGMGLVLGGRSSVVLTGHADASWADDQATQRSSQGYTFSLGSGSVSWRATRSSSVLGSSCEVKIYAGAMTAQELRWLTYLLTDLGEPPRSPPVLYVDNKAMLALCREQRLEHRTKHIALRYFLARELQQRGQLRLAYVASEANTADVFTKALAPCDHQRFCTQLGLVLVLPHLLTS